MTTAPAFLWPVRIYWEDTDAGGIVFYANYLKFFERARTEWLRHLGIEQQKLREESGGMFVVTRTETRYLRPARLDDLLQVTVQVRDLGRATVTLHQEAWSTTEGRLSDLLCESEIRIGWVNADTMQPSRMPNSILEALKHT